MIHQLTEHLLNHWQAVVGDRLPKPRSSHLMKFGSVTDFPRKYVYLYAFLDRASDDSLVLKVTADRTAQARLIREFDLVNRIRARVAPANCARHHPMGLVRPIVVHQRQIEHRSADFKHRAAIV